MEPQLNVDTAALLNKAHTIRLHFDDSPKEQALYAALRASSDREHRNPLPRQIKYLLEMAMGTKPADRSLLQRLGLSSVDLDEFAATGAAAYDSPPATRPATILRLVPGAAMKQKDNKDER